MNDAEGIIQGLVEDLPAGEREPAREILRSCQFRDPSDPVLGLLRYLQLRGKADEEIERPLAAEVAKLAEEMDNRLWEARRYQWGLFVGCVLLAFLAGGLVVGGLFFHAARVNPARMSNYLGLPAEHDVVHDRRLGILQSGGVDLYVEDHNAEIGVVLSGNLERFQPTNGQATVVFRKRQ